MDKASSSSPASDKSAKAFCLDPGRAATLRTFAWRTRKPANSLGAKRFWRLSVAGQRQLPFLASLTHRWGVKIASAVEKKAPKSTAITLCFANILCFPQSHFCVNSINLQRIRPELCTFFYRLVNIAPWCVVGGFAFALEEGGRGRRREKEIANVSSGDQIWAIGGGGRPFSPLAPGKKRGEGYL